MTGHVYLDHNATTPPRPEARAAMLDALDAMGNPSSVHKFGRLARARVETAREAIAGYLGANARATVFTSGGTEANNLVFAGDWDAVLVAATEHESVLAPARHGPHRTSIVPVDDTGQVDLGALDGMLAEAARDSEAPRVLVSVQMVNNETGVIQPIAEAARIAHAHGARLHSDAAQATGRLPVDVAALDADFLTLSAHKFGGPMGIGALLARDAASLPRMLLGGGQEMRSRAGTENVAAIAGFAAAIAAIEASSGRIADIEGLRRDLEDGVRDITPEAVIMGEDGPRVGNTSCIAVPGRSAETLVIALDLAGIAVSAGAACSSGKVAESHVLKAMGLPAEITRAAVRVSLGWTTTKQDIGAFLDAWTDIHARRPAAGRRSGTAALAQLAT